MNTTKFFLSSALAMLFVPLAWAGFSRDIAISEDSIQLQPAGQIVHGQDIRIYVTARNHGDEDLIGTVKIAVDGQQIGTDLPISVKHGGVPDDVFVGWKAVGGTHTFSARLSPYNADGDNPANNSVSKDFFVDYDSDGDGIGDSVDTDDDNDGLSDAEENTKGTNPKKRDSDSDGAADKTDAFPLDPSEQLDTDSDGVGNNADTDDDGEGLPDTAEKDLSTDPLKVDTDGDSVDDLHDQFPADSKESTDSDGDKVGDKSDTFPDDPKEWQDSDKDGTGDNADTDDDNDGYCDTTTNQKDCQVNANGSADAYPLDSTVWSGSDDDHDGYCDTVTNQRDCRLNTDGSADAFPLDPTEWLDSDQDILGDNADPNDKNQGPVIRIGANERTVFVGVPESFDASGSTDVDGSVTKFVWDFGDGSLPVEQPSTPHTFTKLGIYAVKITVTDDAGESRVKTIQVKVTNPPTLENTLFWLLFLLLLIFAVIVYRTIKQRKKSKK